MSPSINTTPSDDSQTLEPHETPGRRLRALRESRKLDIERVAAQLHLQRHVVESIEGDQYERLPAQVFVVGYLKNYARLLGADPAPILDAYRAIVPARETTLGQALIAGNDPAGSGGHGRWLWTVGILLVGVAVGVTALWLRGQSEATLESGALTLAPKSEESAGTVAAPAAASQPADTGAPAETAISAPPEAIPLRGAEKPSLAGGPAAPASTSTPPAPVAANVPATTETLVAATTLATPQTTPAKPLERDADEESAAEDDETPAAENVEPPPAPQTASTEVVLEFTGTSWVDVRGSNGRVVLNGEMRSGDRRVLDGEPPYKFVIGNTAATQLTIGGRPYDLKRRAQGNVARFSLDPNSFE